MKIFRNDTVYVQKDDLLFWFSQPELGIPQAMMELVLSSNSANVRGESSIVLNKHDRHGFVEVTSDEGIEIVKTTEWIDDFDIIDPLPEGEIAKMGLNMAAQARRSAELVEKTCASSVESQILCHRASLLADYLLFRKGRAVWRLPEGVTSVTASKPCLTSRLRDFLELL